MTDDREIALLGGWRFRVAAVCYGKKLWHLWSPADKPVSSMWDEGQARSFAATMNAPNPPAPTPEQYVSFPYKVAEGCKLVQVDPTEAMVLAGASVDFQNEDERAMACNVWHAMFGAASQPPAQPQAARPSSGAGVDVAPVAWRRAGRRAWHYRENAPTEQGMDGWLPLFDESAIRTIAAQATAALKPLVWDESDHTLFVAHTPMGRISIQGRGGVSNLNKLQQNHRLCEVGFRPSGLFYGDSDRTFNSAAEAKAYAESAYIHAYSPAICRAAPPSTGSAPDQAGRADDRMREVVLWDALKVAVVERALHDARHFVKFDENSDSQTRHAAGQTVALIDEALSALKATPVARSGDAGRDFPGQDQMNQAFYVDVCRAEDRMKELCATGQKLLDSLPPHWHDDATVEFQDLVNETDALLNPHQHADRAVAEARKHYRATSVVPAASPAQQLGPATRQPPDSAMQDREGE